MQIHCSDAVIVGCISAAGASENVVSFIPVGFLGMSAFGTCLGGIGGIHLYYPLVVCCCLVDQFLLQIMVGPGYGEISVSFPDSFCCSSDPAEVFQYEKGAFGVLGNECLGDAVVDIVYVTVLSLTYFP